MPASSIQHPQDSNPTGTPLRRWAAPCSVAFQLRNTEVLPTAEEEIYPKKLLNPPAAGTDASIQHPQVSNPTRTPLWTWTAPCFLQTRRLSWYCAMEVKRKRELGIEVGLVALQRRGVGLDMKLMPLQIKAKQAQPAIPAMRTPLEI
jgi:hypothetical protein